MQYIENFLFSITGISYLLIWILVLISIFVIKEKKIDYLLSIAIIFYAFLFIGLRDQYSGTDTIAYVRQFQDIGVTFSFRDSWDLLYNCFALLISQIGDKNLFIISNVLIQLCVILGITIIINIRFKSLILLAYLSFFPGFDMLSNGLRQGISSSLALLIFVLAFHKRKIPKITSLVILGFHKSTLFYPVYYLFDKVLSKAKIIRLIKYTSYIILILIITWQLVDFTNFLKPIFAGLQIPLLDSAFDLGTKLNVYLTSEKNILSWIYRYYFLAIMLFLLGHFYLLKSKFRLPLNKIPNANIWGLTFLLSLSYALVWISPFSYRFMYTAYLPGLVASISSLDLIGERKFYVLYLLFILIAAILTYGSNTYSNFEYIF